MPYANYRDIEQAISNLEEFRGSSARGEIDGNEYVIISYETEMARVRLSDGEVLTFNDKYYSSTTSRLQNIIKRVLNIK